MFTGVSFPDVPGARADAGWCGTLCLGGSDRRAPDRRAGPRRAVRRPVTILRREAADGVSAALLHFADACCAAGVAIPPARKERQGIRDDCQISASWPIGQTVAEARRHVKRRTAGPKRGRMADMTLPALPEGSVQRVLCVVAPPDDMEYGTPAAVARWTARGIEVGYLLLTRGEAGMPNPPEETAPLPLRPQQAARARVGVTHL